MEKINKSSLKNILGNISNVLNDKKEYLIELDALLGDGDLGLTMTKGFKAVYDEVENIDSDDIGIVLMKLGMKMNSVVASTMGTLISICFLKSAKKVKGKTEIGLMDFVEMGKASILGISERGKAKVGDRTMLDALNPAIESLATSLNDNVALDKAFNNAVECAKKGVENTKSIKPTFGRAAYYSDRAIGIPDPGAVAIMLIFTGISNYFNNKH